MRLYAMSSATFGMVLLAQAMIAQCGSGKDIDAERITSLIKQLGNDEFVKREAASKELNAIGEPSLEALRKAAASGDDAEIRRRAELLERAITGRIQAAAAKKDLEKLQGVWVLVSVERNAQAVPNQDKTVTMTFSANKWVCKGAGEGPFELVDATKDPKKWNFNNTTMGVTGYGIYLLDGDTFKYCAHDAGPEARPADFTTKNGDGRYCLAWKRSKP